MVELSMVSPLVSIIVPSYNRAHVLMGALQSVLRQPYDNMEVVVVDDASSDETQKIVQEMNDKRIHYVRHEHNKGAAESRNTGIRAARGEYIAFQDSDDAWANNRLARQVEMIRKADPSVGAVFGSLEKRYKNGSKAVVPNKSYHHESRSLYEKLLDENFITPQVFLAKATAVRNVGFFDEALDSLEDWDYFVRFAKQYEMIFDDSIVAYAAIGEDSLTANRIKRLRAREGMYKKHHEEYLKFPNIAERMCFRLAKGYAYQHDALRARQYSCDAFHFRKSLKNYVMMLLLWLGPTVFTYTARLYEAMRRNKYGIQR